MPKTKFLLFLTRQICPFQIQKKKNIFRHFCSRMRSTFIWILVVAIFVAAQMVESNPIGSDCGDEECSDAPSTGQANWCKQMFKWDCKARQAAGEELSPSCKKCVPWYLIVDVATYCCNRETTLLVWMPHMKSKFTAVRICYCHIGKSNDEFIVW